MFKSLLLPERSSEPDSCTEGPKRRSHRRRAKHYWGGDNAPAPVLPPQAIRRRRRAKASSPPAAKIRPGRPAPTTGPGTGANTATQPNGQPVPAAIGTQTSPLKGFTVIECALVVVGTVTVCKTLPLSSTTSKNRVPGVRPPGPPVT